MKKVYEIVLTGGPCAGKTSALAYLTEKLGEWGFRVLTVPEVATMFITAGLSDIGQLDPSRYFRVEQLFLMTQRDLRQRFRALAETIGQQRTIIIADRAEMDVAAYVDDFPALVRPLGLNLSHVRDNYDGVIHLVTAAIGAESAYTQANNRARRESLEQAVEADRRTLNAWIGHPHLRVIDNSTDFAGKLDRVLAQVARIVGYPVPLEIERKFLLAADFSPNLVPELRLAVRVDIEQTYLADGSRLRRRAQDGQATYYLTHKRAAGPVVRYETEERITERHFEEMMAYRDTNRRTVCKHRYCFVYASQYFELDVILEPSSRTCNLLEIELTEQNDLVELPPWLPVEREVTGQESYSNFALAVG